MLKFDLLFFILKMVIFSPKLLKNGIFGQWIFFFLLIDICTNAYGVPCFLGCTNSLKLVLYELISWLFILKMTIFWLKMANNGQKWNIIWSKITLFFVCQPIRQCLICTMIIWYGFYCIIGEVLVDLLPFSKWRKNSWGLIFWFSKLFIVFIWFWV